MMFADAVLALCGIAARVLGWRPGEFWSATPAELAACLADPPGPAPSMARGDLERLMDSDGHG